MPNEKNVIDEPMNVEERYLYAMVMRLDALCHMVSSLVEHIAQKEGVAVETNTEQIVKPRKARKREE